MKQTNHPFIVTESNIRSKHPVIAGTGIRVIDIAIEYQYKGYTIDQIIDYHPHLQLQQIHDALSYYYENQQRFDQEIKEENKFAEELKKQGLYGSQRLEPEYA